MENGERNDLVLKSFLELTIMIIEGAKDKEDALAKLKSLSIIKSHDEDSEV